MKVFERKPARKKWDSFKGRAEKAQHNLEEAVAKIVAKFKKQDFLSRSFLKRRGAPKLLWMDRFSLGCTRSFYKYPYALPKRRTRRFVIPPDIDFSQALDSVAR
jgi:hypothetical protein